MNFFDLCSWKVNFNPIIFFVDSDLEKLVYFDQFDQFMFQSFYKFYDIIFNLDATGHQILDTYLHFFA